MVPSNKFKGACGAGFDAQRLPLAQFAFKRFSGFRIETHNPQGTVFCTKPTGYAFVRVNGHDSGRIPFNGPGRAGIHTIGVFTLVADNGDMIQGLLFMENDQPGKPGVVSTKKIHRTGKLADAATRAFIKIGMDEIADNALRLMVLAFYKKRISHITYYVNSFVLLSRFFPCFNLWTMLWLKSHITYYILCDSKIVQTST